ncbi:MAG: acyltransferase domain-containing protein, partial [Chloroflexota bacterium]|nr:acyltransferase domain-containing protein [Chloroflexota bacterium]
QSITSYIYSKNNRKINIFDQTLYTHPAIFMVECVLAQILLNQGIKPDYVLGTSIGEFASAAIANVMSPEEALLALLRQAEALESSCERGGMLTILSEPNLYQGIALLHENSELVSINYSSHFVLSGLRTSIKRIEEFLKKRQINYQSLPVTKAFHSSNIDPAAETYLDFLNQKYYKPPQIPFISCVQAVVLNTLGKRYFWEVVRRPIRFREAFEELDKKPGLPLSRFRPLWYAS